jgi:2-keto-4-pentenoate hydratase/2-oxohepta-3-ene-1,7-dioic acid hydratase in catechol pathway
VGTPGKYIEEAFALRHIDGIGLGLDLTARDLQRTAKQQGLPWEIAKGFNDSAPVSEIFPLDEFGPLDDISFSLHHNGAQVQAGHTSMMLFQLPEIVAYASRFFTLKTGDLIFTGTPEGVGRLSVGDTLTGAIDGRELLWCEVK